MGFTGYRFLGLKTTGYRFWGLNLLVTDFHNLLVTDFGPWNLFTLFQFTDF
jgi:hypothetical protein